MDSDNVGMGLVRNLVYRRADVAALEGYVLGDQFVEKYPSGVDVGTCVDRGSADLLRRHVLDAADHHAGAGMPVIAELRDAEVHKFDRALRQEDHIPGLDVAMDDLAHMRVVHSGAYLIDDAQRLCEKELPVGCNDLIQALTLQELRHTYQFEMGCSLPW
jgi:hypothetical protein